MGENEKIVREAWNNARFESVLEASRGWPEQPRVVLPRDRGRIICDRPGGGCWILSGNSNTLFEISRALPEATAWSAARVSTDERKEQIRLVEEEINLLRGWKWVCLENNPAAMRILATRQAALTELKLGMKETNDQAAHSRCNGN